MKRRITANRTNETSPAVLQFIRDISDLFYNSGYSITGHGTEENIILEVKCREAKPDMMPTIHLDGKVLDDYIYVASSLTFPHLDYNPEDTNDYYDTVHYWLSKWERVGRYLAELHEYSFDLQAYYSDDKEE